jgi:hypothetical protein
MMEAIAACIEAAPDAPDASQLVLGKEHLEAAIRQLASQTARVQHG